METSDFLRSLGTAIASQRRTRKLTQEKLAEALCTSPEWISQVERGVGKPSVDMLLTVAQALEVSPAALVDAACAGEGPGVPEAAELLLLVRRLDARAARVLLDAARAVEREYGGSGAD
ncbi:MAG: helix-turn-helix domain-containing protein [Myxococcota bacterium]